MMSLSTNMTDTPNKAPANGKAAASSTKFLFDMSFDVDEEAAAEVDPTQPARTAEEPPPPPPPSYNEDELAQACAAARSEGEALGRQAADADADARADQMVQSLLGQVGDMVATQQQSDGQLVQHAVGIAMAAARKALPAMARRGGLTEIEDMVREILGGMLDEPRVVIRVADSVLDDLRARIDTIGQRLGFQGSVVLLADPDMGPADCRIDWADGGAERLARTVWADIDAAVDRIFKDGQAADPASPSPQPLT